MRCPCDSTLPRKALAGQELPAASTDFCLTAFTPASHVEGFFAAFLGAGPAATLRADAESPGIRLLPRGHSARIWPRSWQP